MGLSYAIEATSFTFITLLVARLGTSVMAGHQIVANLAALCFMVPLSLAVATATLTAHAIGAEDAERARRTAATGIRIALIAGASLALAVWTLRHPIVRLYTNDAAVAAVALTLVPFLAAFHVFDAVQTAVGFVLRAHKRAVAPTVVYALALWGVGLCGGYQVAFRGVWGPPRGVTGMWLMQSVGLGLAGALLLGFYVWLTRQRLPLGRLARTNGVDRLPVTRTYFPRPRDNPSQTATTISRCSHVRSRGGSSHDPNRDRHSHRLSGSDRARAGRRQRGRPVERDDGQGHRGAMVRATSRRRARSRWCRGRCTTR